MSYIWVLSRLIESLVCPSVILLHAVNGNKKSSLMGNWNLRRIEMPAFIGSSLWLSMQEHHRIL